MKDPKKPYLDAEFKKLAEKVGLISPLLKHYMVQDFTLTVCYNYTQSS